MFKKLIASGVHIGKKTNKWNPKTSIYLYGQRKINPKETLNTNILTSSSPSGNKTNGINIHIIDIEQTILMLRRAITFIQKISKNRGMILYVPSLNQLEKKKKEKSEAEKKATSFRRVGVAVGEKGVNDPIYKKGIKPKDSLADTSGNIVLSLNYGPLKEDKRKERGNIRSNDGIINIGKSTNANKDITLWWGNAKQKNVRLQNSEEKEMETLRKGNSAETTSTDLRSRKPRRGRNDNSCRKKISSSLGLISSPSGNIREKILELNKQRNERFYIPEALFITNTTEHKTLIREAMKLQIPIIGIIDTNGNSYGIEFPIPGNTESIEAQEIYTQIMFYAIADGKKHEVEMFI